MITPYAFSKRMSVKIASPINVCAAERDEFSNVIKDHRARLVSMLEKTHQKRGTGLWHYSAECSCSDAPDAIRIMHISGKEEFRIAVSDGNLVRLCESVGNVRERQTDAGRQADVALSDIFKLRRDRQRFSVFDNEKIHSVFKNVGVACAAIDACYLSDDGTIVHKFANQPDMLESNSWSMRGQNRARLASAFSMCSLQK